MFSFGFSSNGVDLFPTVYDWRSKVKASPTRSAYKISEFVFVNSNFHS